jgi:hypothetical protein
MYKEMGCVGRVRRWEGGDDIGRLYHGLGRWILERAGSMPLIRDPWSWAKAGVKNAICMPG